MKTMKLLVALMLFSFVQLNAQEEPPKDWFHMDASKDGYNGVSSHEVYKTILKDKQGEEVIVAVIDSGVDVEHEDLVGNIWVNKGEIPDNGKDDDGNGYIDDVNGWNFIGGANGENVNHENLEVARLYKKYKDMFGDRSNDKGLNKKQRKMFAEYLVVKDEIEKSRGRAQSQLDYVAGILKGVDKVKESLGAKAFNMDNLGKAADKKDEDVQKALPFLMQAAGQGKTDFAEVETAIQDRMNGAVEYFEGQLKYHYNPDLNTRTIIGDNYADQTERYYGNNDVEGPDALHGTHVAGIIAAVRNNDVGMDGVAGNVKIMSIRTVPDGDERDKDVANAIRYAVDNGASIINMSFGKSFSWNKNVVDKAVKYAVKNDVLLVHAAGNDGKDIDSKSNFPTDTYAKRGWFSPKSATKTWIEVGALNHAKGENLAAPFSNYGTNNVDLFAPGMAIYSTLPDNEYRNLQGTSMAAPVVAGVAAMLRSYYPKLSSAQIKNILMQSVVKNNDQVIKPGTKDEKVAFGKLSVAGGIVNAKKAVEIAARTKGKRKVKKKAPRA